MFRPTSRLWKKPIFVHRNEKKIRMKKNCRALKSEKTLPSRWNKLILVHRGQLKIIPLWAKIAISQGISAKIHSNKIFRRFTPKMTPEIWPTLWACGACRPQNNTDPRNMKKNAHMMKKSIFFHPPEMRKRSKNIINIFTTLQHIPFLHFLTHCRGGGGGSGKFSWGARRGLGIISHTPLKYHL